MDNWKSILQLVNDEVAHLPYTRKPESLYAPIQYVLSMGGKRIRPVLMLMAYQLYRDDVKTIMSQAVAIETYHNYTLLHDDLMDRADMRRGMTTVHKKWNDNAAILSGDSMLVMAYQYMLAHCPDDKVKPVMELFTETALQIGEGQQYDIEFETRDDVSEAEYIEMIRLKTSVLLACALKIGAIMADAPAQDSECLYRFGESIGLAFQLQDDFLDVYGNPKVFGKKIGGDILCNKKTYMLINALRLARGEEQDQLNHWLSQPDGTYQPDEKIAAVTDVYNKVGIKTLCNEKIDFYFKQAKQELSQLNVPEEKKEYLWELAQTLLHRES